MSDIFKYTKKARPTEYGGRTYRSELEASWAAFFDLRTITYEYEPLIDLVAWRPDFHISLIDGDDFVLAEVKPYLKMDQWKNDSPTLGKINDSFLGIGFRVVLLGASPLLPANCLFGINPDVIGPIGPENPKFDRLDFGDADILKDDWSRAKNEVMWRPK